MPQAGRSECDLCVYREKSFTAGAIHKNEVQPFLGPVMVSALTHNHYRMLSLLSHRLRCNGCASLHIRGLSHLQSVSYTRAYTLHIGKKIYEN